MKYMSIIIFDIILKAAVHSFVNESPLYLSTILMLSN